jgi:uncharacterized UPF0160 family protein
LIEYLDGNDNGVTQYVSTEPARYKNNTSLASRISRLNPSWNETGVNVDVSSLYLLAFCPVIQLNSDQERFRLAMKVAEEEVLNCVHYLHDSWLPARSLVVESFEKRFDIHPSGKIMKLDTFCPWKSYLFQLEEEQHTPAEQMVQYVLYEDESKRWRVQAVPASPDSFECRLALPSEWRGVRDDALDKLIGLDGCIFVHAAGFIGGHQKYEGALHMATMSLQIAESNAAKRKASEMEQ